jgi:hypothetical protein
MISQKTICNLHLFDLCKLNIEIQSEPWRGRGHQAYNKREKVATFEKSKLHNKEEEKKLQNF